MYVVLNFKEQELFLQIAMVGQMKVLVFVHNAVANVLLGNDYKISCNDNDIYFTDNKRRINFNC